MHSDDFVGGATTVRHPNEKAQRERAVNAQMTRLQQSCESLDKELCVLLGRLERVSRQTDPAESPAMIEAATKGPECPLSQELQVCVEHLDGLRRRIGRARDALEV